MKYKKLTPKIIGAVEEEVKMMLHASRDCLRNLKKDTSTLRFKTGDGYYGEAFGVMRCLKLFNYGYFGPVNIPDQENPKRNLRWWFASLEEMVLEEEGWGTDNKCNHCVERYGKDGAGRTRGDVK